MNGFAKERLWVVAPLAAHPRLRVGLPRCRCAPATPILIILARALIQARFIDAPRPSW